MIRYVLSENVGMGNPTHNDPRLLEIKSEWMNHRFDALDGDRIVGYCRVSCIPHALWDVHWDTIYKYLGRNQGWRYGTSHNKTPSSDWEIQEAERMYGRQDYRDYYNFQNFWLNKPVVSFLWVADCVPILEVGTQMVLRMAEYLCDTHNMPLYFSSLEVGNESPVCARIRNSGDVPVYVDESGSPHRKFIWFR